MNELPTFTSSAHSHSTYSGMGLGNAPLVWNATGLTVVNDPSINPYSTSATRRVTTHAHNTHAHHTGTIYPVTQPKQDDIMAAATKTRIVRVFLVDPDTRVPVEKRVLHRTEELTTDDTDQELFFQLPVTQLLAKHNAYREGVEFDEKESGETKRRKGLKPVRIRDLKMTVVTLAEF
jgi:hypothetical protein